VPTFNLKGMSRNIRGQRGGDIVRHMTVLFLNYLFCFSGPTVLAACLNNNKKKTPKNKLFNFCSMTMFIRDHSFIHLLILERILCIRKFCTSHTQKCVCARIKKNERFCTQNRTIWQPWCKRITQVFKKLFSHRKESE
jgi:hypothetical protein